MYQHAQFDHVTNENLVLKNCIFHDFGILDLRTTEPFRSDTRTFFSNLRTFGLKNLRTHEPSNLRTFGLIGCNRLRSSGERAGNNVFVDYITLTSFTYQINQKMWFLYWRHRAKNNYSPLSRNVTDLPRYE